MRSRLLALFLLAISPLFPAHAARVERCEVALHLPAGTVTLAGHGATVDAAWRSAERTAATVGALHAQIGLLGGLVVDPAYALGRHARQLQRVASVDDGPGPAPGVRIERGTCTRLRLPRNPSGAAWAVIWRPGEAEILRNDPASAIDAARRRACLGSFQRDAIQAFARFDSEQPWRDVVVPLSDASEALLRCVSAPTPNPRPGLAPLPQPEGRGVWACHRPRQHEGRWVLSPGYGDSVEAAREAALTRDALVVTRRALADAMALLLGPPDPEALQQTVEPLRTLVVGSDLVEQGLALCAVAPAEPMDFAWTLPETCGQPEPPISLVASAPALERLSGQRCDAVLHAGASASLRQLGSARSDEGALFLRGLGTALSCAASCTTDHRIRGWEPMPVQSPGGVDRSDAERAAAALETALALRDLPSLGILTGGTLLHPRYVRVEREDPDAFWGSLLEVVRAGRLSEVARWEHVAGQWLLTFE